MTIYMPSWHTQRQLTVPYVCPHQTFPLWGVSWEIRGGGERGIRGGEISQGTCNSDICFTSEMAYFSVKMLKTAICLTF